MNHPDRAAPRKAWLAGATGLVGHALLPLLAADPQCAAALLLVRRAVPGLALAGRLETLRVDFAQLPAHLPATDDVFIALGTTIRQAGSQAAFEAVDLGHVLAVAHAGRAAGATRLGVVSALGADADSGVFYNRVKGQMEAAVGALGYESVVIARPSLLLGDRAALGQGARAAEQWTTRLAAPIGRLIPRRWRPIAADAVAAALLRAVREGRPGTRILESGAMQA